MSYSVPVRSTIKVILKVDAIFTSDVDVIVCDGFVGNVAIKTSEGLSKFIQQALRREFEHSII